MLSIIDPKTLAEFDAMRALCWQYRDHLLTMPPLYAEVIRNYYTDEVYQGIVEALETDHVPPHGGAKLAMKQGLAVGCGMFHTLLPETAEIKRVFVSEAARGTGAGQALMQGLIAQCRAQGFRRILMDTAAPLTAATTLYLSLGFTLRGPYQRIPTDNADLLRYFEMDL